jgi:predicted TIM-barrel fold metal-dependent hydrolase
MTVIDFHTQILPDRVSRSLPEPARKWGKFWSKPVSKTLHEIQPWVRFLPGASRTVVEEVGALAPILHFAFESSADDLRESMEENGIDRSVVASDPSRLSNDDLLAQAESDSRFVAAIRIPIGEKDAKSVIARAHERGARILQLHPAADGIAPSDDAYSAQLDAAAERGWIAIVQTGAPKAHLAYRKPEAAAVRGFEPWFSRWAKTPFVLARMGFSDPGDAMDLAERHPNVRLETSWQPPEIIAESVRRIGAERVLFGSDWPVLGNNQRIGLSRIRDARESQLFSEGDGRRILGADAVALIAEAMKG